MLAENSSFLIIRRIGRRKPKQRKKKFSYILIIFFSVIMWSSIIFFCIKIFKHDKISTKQMVEIPIRKKNDSTWFLWNATEIIDTYINLIPSQYDKTRKEYKQAIENIASLKVYSEDDEKNIKLLRDKFSEKFKKNSSLVKNIFITKTGGLGNQICAFNNIIFYSEILGIKNIYLNDAFNNWYIKNKIITNKLNISLSNKNQINCNSEDTFCGHIYFDFFFL